MAGVRSALLITCLSKLHVVIVGQVKIVVGDAQVIPVFMPSGEDVEVSPPSIDFSFIPSVSHSQQDGLSCPDLPAGATF